MAPNSKLNAKRKAAREATKPRTSGKVEKQKEDKVATPAQIPVELQQLLLNIFRNAFSEKLQTDFAPLLQEVKGHLFNRDFATAFGREDYLEVYAARWSPSRALCYTDVFWSLRDYYTEDITVFSATGAEDSISDWNVVCLGGGAGAEAVAFAGLQNLLLREGSESALRKKIVVSAIDIADWGKVMQKLRDHVFTLPPLSKYASAAAKEANAPLLDTKDISISFGQQDVLDEATMTNATYLSSADLVTMLFTLNELYSTSLSATQKFLLNLTLAMKPGSLLLVIDSPGSYSSITLNGADKKYPMQWLLDHTLLKQVNDNQKERGKEEVAKWEKIEEDDSRWFRLSEELRYPIELENMRMQLHLYRRL